ncbi:hypothetical protein IEQ_04923 [Bacillus cereus BAG6X1-2]|nr:hypothetical protein IEQ_04923 [Bacillus cereus BAG6X1-2]
MQQKIDDKVSAIKQLKIKNDKLTREIEYQTEAEKLKTKNTMNSTESVMKNHQKVLDDLKEEIKMKEKKIDLLDEKKKNGG